MKFLTPCFVRVENPAKRQELIEWLVDSGRPFSCDSHYLLSKGGYVVALNEQCTIMGRPSRFMTEELGFIDCGTNVDLFKALAAMNDSNDKEQWYVLHTPCYPGDVVGKMLFDPFGTPNAKYVRKATAEEIIEHFSDNK